ncbi:RICIN domain-containing protein [Rubellicoccus peritrichatus]|uniref:RICIN domain-containing protein n=1 Tax=Rubellicoccus peritrichatus TaxID=3080537 RepID=A0AAQ3QWE1_9BACT|nr:RICIN domain-containing protein [Puniceicoccus sp. CR14]WOO42603.1 RICIN domain-containing protein [Puniceicoccus sp. CR14]
MKLNGMHIIALSFTGMFIIPIYAGKELFTIRSEAGRGSFLEPSKNIEWSTVRHRSQAENETPKLWEIEKLEDGLYRITCDGMALTVVDDKEWSDVQLGVYNGWKSQHWKIEAMESGHFMITHANGLVLTGPNKTDDLITEVASSQGWSTQKWIIESFEVVGSD